ncbi:MAG TPA: glycosyltransferase family 87 protein, partial [Verrucomicrobiae bacterium]|nr:glycosyltransferase family 87 protein [Verrucomicrobiae bacterium]
MIAPRISRLFEALASPASAADLLAVVLLVFLPVNFLYGAVLTHLRPPDKNDFTSYYVAARVVESGRANDLYYPEPKGSLLAQASIEHPWIDVARSAGIDNPNYYLYPPLFAVAFVPLATLPYGVAFGAWLLLNVGFLAGALVLCLPPRGLRTLPGFAAALLVALTFYPVWHHLKIGQSSLLVLLLLAACLALLRRGREGAAGIALSGAILLKLTPVIFIPFLWMRGRRRAAIVSAAGVAALTALSLAVTGWPAQITYVTRMVPLLSAGTAFYPNQSLNGFVTRLLGAGDLMKADLSTGLGAARAASGAAAAVLLALSFLAIHRRRREAGARGDEDGFALLTVASLLASPISWEHHYVCLLLPAWILIGRYSGGEAPRRGVAPLTGAALALAGSYVGLAVFEKFGVGPIHPLLSSAAFIGAGILWMLFASGAVSPGDPAGAPGPARDRPGVVALFTLMAVFAGGQFLLKLAEYDTSFSYGDFTSYYVAASAVTDGRADALYEPATPDQIL